MTPSWAGTYDLPNSPRSPALARTLLRQALAACPPEMVEAAQLLVSELVTNGIRHAESGLVLEIQVDRPGIRVAVQDASPEPPRPGHPPADADGGRGLPLVAALARDWGWDQISTGKRVWFEL